MPADAPGDRNLNILFLTRYGRDGPSSRVRAIQFFPALEAAGIRPTLAPFFGEDYLASRFQGRFPLPALVRAYAGRMAAARTARRFDAVWIEKELFPWLPGFAERALEPAVPWVVDYDDAIFHRYEERAPAPLGAMLSRKVDALMRRATLVTAGSRYLAEHARQAGARRVELLPSVVPVSRYRPASRPAGAPFTIGWIGSPITAPFLEAVRGPLEAAVRDLGARILLVGAGDAALPGLAAERRPWREDTEATDLAEIDVGIMPLPDTPFERGKCGYKLVQYMAAGKPVVASPVGANNDLVSSGADGFLAAGDEAWNRAFTRFAANPAEAAAMGLRGREKVESRYCVEVLGPRLAALLREVASVTGAMQK